MCECMHRVLGTARARTKACVWVHPELLLGVLRVVRAATFCRARSYDWARGMGWGVVWSGAYAWARRTIAIVGVYRGYLYLLRRR